MTTVVENKKKLTTVEENKKEDSKEKELTGEQIYYMLTLGNLVPVWRQAIASFLFYKNTILLNSIVLKYDTKNFKKFKIAIDNKTFYMLL